MAQWRKQCNFNELLSLLEVKSSDVKETDVLMEEPPLVKSDVFEKDDDH